MKCIIPLLALVYRRCQPKGGPPQPPLMECGAHGDVEILCGTRSPEDLELTPDGKFLIVSQFVNGRGGGGRVPGWSSSISPRRPTAKFPSPRSLAKIGARRRVPARWATRSSRTESRC